MRTALATGSPLEDAARRALLQRVADGLQMMAKADQLHWTCCWLDFPVPDYRLGWTWRFCEPFPPGEWPYPLTCGHWHHRHEPPPLA